MFNGFDQLLRHYNGKHNVHCDFLSGKNITNAAAGHAEKGGTTKSGDESERYKYTCEKVRWSTHEVAINPIGNFFYAPAFGAKATGHENIQKNIYEIR